jgi:hypothetical protein
LRDGPLTLGDVALENRLVIFRELQSGCIGFVELPGPPQDLDQVSSAF